MKNVPFAFAAMFLLSLSPCFAQSAQGPVAPVLDKDKAPQRAQAAPAAKLKSPATSSPASAGAGLAKASAPAEKIGRPRTKDYGPSAGAALPTARAKTRRAPNPADRGKARVAGMARTRRIPLSTGPNDPLAKLYDVRRLLNQLSSTDSVDSRRAAYGEARKLVSRAIRMINAARATTG